LPESPSPSASPSKGLVLLAEDYRDTREALAIILRDDGYSVKTAANGVDALAMLRLGVRPSVIVLDLMLPMMDGAELLGEMALDPNLADIPVVVITGARARESVLAFRNVRAVLRKPFPFLRLISAIEEACASG
jgi:CheY-like chemotaxis protein